MQAMELYILQIINLVDAGKQTRDTPQDVKQFRSEFNLARLYL